MKKLKHTPIKNLITNIHGYQQTIYDINIQRQENNKAVIIEKTLKGNMNSHQKTNTLWLVTPTQKLENPIFSSREHMRQQSGKEKSCGIQRSLRRSNCVTKRHPSKIRIGIPQHSVLRKTIPLSRGQD